MHKKPELVDSESFILCTIHRAENTDDEIRIRAIFEALEEIALTKTVVLPIHPRTRKMLEKYDITLKNITVIEPVGYLQMVWLIDHCDLVMTDSGGLQKEAFFFAKPCITLRDETEWVELVENNFNVLAGADKEQILTIYQEHIFATNFDVNLYGGGKASEIIVNNLITARA